MIEITKYALIKSKPIAIIQTKNLNSFMTKIKIGIIGARGIPNNHGGFEQFAEYLSQFLVKKGHVVSVYNSSNHPYKKQTWKGINIIHKFDPENKIGTFGQFIYDLNCILHCRKSDYDVILQLGYTSSSIWGKLMPSKSLIITNMDGLEWQRSKYNSRVQTFLKYAEFLAVKHSDYLIADSIGIKKYIDDKYSSNSKFIAYGANLFINPEQDILEKYQVEKNSYNILIARLEPENNVEIILDGMNRSSVAKPFLVIGKHETKFGAYLKSKYISNPKIIFLGAIYSQKDLDNLRFFSNLYFHGHSVGGTNPSLLEAMASSSLIVAHDNIFNKSILNNDAFYFRTDNDILKYLQLSKSENLNLIERNKQKINNKYTWDNINSQYEKFFKQCLRN